MSPRPNFKERQAVLYAIQRGGGRMASGEGRVVQIDERGNGWWIVLHDKAANRTIEARPSQVMAKSRRGGAS